MRRAGWNSPLLILQLGYQEWGTLKRTKIFSQSPNVLGMTLLRFSKRITFWELCAGNLCGSAGDFCAHS